MKKPLIISAALIVACALPGLLKQQELAKLKAERDKLSARASNITQLDDRNREENEKQVRDLLFGVVQLSRKLEGISKNGSRQSEEYHKTWSELIGELEKVSSAQFPFVIAELRKESGLSPETMREIIGLAIIQLSTQNPQAALQMMAQHGELLGKGDLRSDVISSSLSSLASQDPQAALDWVAQNAEKYAKLQRDEIHYEIIAATAKNDPRLALKFIRDLKLADPAEALHAIVETSSGSADERSKILKLVREHLEASSKEGKIEEIRNDAFEAFARNLPEEGIDAMTQWIEKARLTDDEKRRFTNGLTYFATRADTGRWIDWVAANLPADQLTGPVSQLVAEWTQQDYQSAGKWLAAAPDSPAKHTAVLAYAQAIAEYEPQVADQWAMTIPPGPVRDEALRAIYRNWPSSDPTGAAAFATKHKMQ